MTPSRPAPEAAGYVLNVPPSRRDALLDAARRGRMVAQSVEEFAHSRRYPLICFIGFEDGAVTHLALGRRGQWSETDKRRLNLHDLVKLSAPVAHAAILDRIPRRFYAPVAQRFAEGGMLPPGSFVAVVDAIRELVSESNQILERFSARRGAELAELSANVRRALAFEKETVATALALAGIDTARLQEWRPQILGRQVSSFLDGLPQARLREDQMSIHDLYAFPGLEVVKTTQHASAVFTNDEVTLTVVMANRLGLEEQTGADLIYRNETFGSFVFVQYKAMEAESGSPLFRLPNPKLADQLKRMDSLWEDLQKCPPESGLGAFRFKENPFFLKLCPKITFDPDDRGLSKGMYIPLEYWRHLETDPSTVGPLKGRSVTYQNVGRYLNNTLFCELVAGGWIGTTMKQTSVLDDMIRDILESGRTVTVAVKRNLTLEEQQGLRAVRTAKLDEDLS